MSGSPPAGVSQSRSAAGDIIGKDGDGVAYIGQVTTANSGTVFGVTMMCLETP